MLKYEELVFILRSLYVSHIPSSELPLQHEFAQRQFVENKSCCAQILSTEGGTSAGHNIGYSSLPPLKLPLVSIS